MKAPQRASPLRNVATRLAALSVVLLAASCGASATQTESGAESEAEPAPTSSTVIENNIATESYSVAEPDPDDPLAVNVFPLEVTVNPLLEAGYLPGGFDEIALDKWYRYDHEVAFCGGSYVAVPVAEPDTEWRKINGSRSEASVGKDWWGGRGVDDMEGFELGYVRLDSNSILHFSPDAETIWWSAEIAPPSEQALCE